MTHATTHPCSEFHLPAASCQFGCSWYPPSAPRTHPATGHSQTTASATWAQGQTEHHTSQPKLSTCAMSVLRMLDIWVLLSSANPAALRSERSLQATKSSATPKLRWAHHCNNKTKVTTSLQHPNSGEHISRTPKFRWAHLCSRLHSPSFTS